MIDREDLLFFYIEQNNSLEETAKHFNCGTTTIKRYLSKYNIHKSKELSLERQKQTCSDRYGQPYPAMVESIKIKSKHRVWTEEQRKELGLRMSKLNLGNTPKNKYSLLEAENIVKEKYPNIELLEYNNQYKLKYKCNLCGYESNGSLFRLKNNGCSNCRKINKKPRENTWNRVSREDFAKHFKDLAGEEYTLLSDYTKAEDFIKVKHEACGHIWKVRARQFYSVGSRCPACAKLVSKQEKDLRKFIESAYSGEICYNTRDIINPYELDIYIPEYQVAIEYNGAYWHSDMQKDKNYHFNKSKLCEEKGIRLIHIWEYEWNNERQRPILENIIQGALHLNNTIYARKCSIVIKSSKEMKEFFNTNNIQGFRPGKFAICLEYSGEVVMSYLFGKAYFGKGKYELEVIRGATKLGINVVGGASKIWKYFIEHYSVNSCVYYVDYNYFNGSSLLSLPNMKYIKTQISYKNYFIDSGEIKNRNPYKDKEIRELYKQGKVLQIYNAGVKVYVWERPKI